MVPLSPAFKPRRNIALPRRKLHDSPANNSVSKSYGAQATFSKGACYSPGNAERVKMVNGRFLYKDPEEQRSSGQVPLRTLRIGMRTRYLENLKSKHLQVVQRNSCMAKRDAA